MHGLVSVSCFAIFLFLQVLNHTRMKCPNAPKVDFGKDSLKYGVSMDFCYLNLYRSKQLHVSINPSSTVLPRSVNLFVEAHG